jgi:hypothetical protein
VGSGHSRAEVVLPKLKELNPICSFSICSSLDELSLKGFSAIVITQILELDALVSLNERCRNNGVSFFYAFTGGVTASVFVDHGSDHIVTDFDGKKPMQKLITDIVPLNDKECLLCYDTPEGQQAVSLYKGAFEVTEVEGIHGINGQVFEIQTNDSDPVKSTRLPFSLQPGDVYHSGRGLLTEKKLPVAHPMDSLQTKLKHPGDPWATPPTLVQTDYFGSEVQQHVAFYAVHVFYQKMRFLPRCRSESDYAETLQIAKDLLASKAIELNDFDLNEDLFVK